MNNFRTLLAVIAFCLFIVFRSASFAAVPSRSVEIHAHRYAFAPSEITVKKGETVRLILISDDVPHSLLVKDLGIDQVIQKSHPSEVTFTASQAGNFHGRCGRFCGGGHGEMIFTVHVTGN
jgi:cytochrome c oxidase subunit 2